MIKNAYTFKGQDITLDIIMKMEDVVYIIAKRENRPFDECLTDFTATRAYGNLQNTESRMWAESAEFIADDYFRETNHD